METELEREITNLVAEIIEMEPQELWDKRSLQFVEELGVDSMLSLEVLAALEKKYRIEIPEENVLDLVHLQATIDLVQRRIQESAA